MQINIETHMTLEAGVSSRLGEILSQSYKSCLLVIDSGFCDTKIGERKKRILSKT